ncbi:Pom152p [Sugiyamaella lignohabitans]|uniref:Pom152p n=1 Tax=Sugiyamaella lignohabitans TaxID=796027 RepID=A0A167ELJ4_9ASCO|nr:Pom152p [Sugiyamaella lignohabitans]ANB14219.1 Pom152p [Sugiyamaella lignohabitans]
MNQRIQVATKYASLKMDTSKPGTYRYKIKGVSDGVYDLSDLNLNSNTPVVVEQVVEKRPTAAFVNKGRDYKTCVNSYIDGDSDQSVEGIGISLVGQAPFTLGIELHHESTGKVRKLTIPDINQSTFKLKSIFKNLSLGRYTVSFTSIVDGKGCSSSDFRDDERVHILVSDVPKITPLNPKDNYCVGERIGFALDGVPPFDVVYEFNGKRQHAITRTSPFSRLASTDGNLTFISLSDSVSNCEGRLDHMSPIIIRPIPSVRIREEISRQDIHEGDQAELIFSFTGTPPYSFTYTRSELVGRPAKLTVVESHSVSDVNSSEYSIFTSTQGTYEVVALEDAYCSVSNR